MTRSITPKALDLLKQFEGCSLRAYQDEAGVWTQGYGRTQGITSASPPITQEQAEAWLEEDVYKFCRLVESECEADLGDNQFSALVLLCFNVGTGPLFGRLGRDLDAGRYTDAANDFLAWDKSHIDEQLQEIPGLTMRRRAERALFLTGDNV